MNSVILVAGAGIFLVSAGFDLCSRRLPNALSLTLAALGVGRLALAGDASAAFCTITAAAAVFAGGFALFWRGLIGGGDAKLTAAAILMVGHHALAPFLLAMSLCGLIVTLATLAAGKLMPRLAAAAHANPPDDEPAQPTVPYGVAIAAAGLLMLLFQSPVTG